MIDDAGSSLRIVLYRTIVVGGIMEVRVWISVEMRYEVFPGSLDVVVKVLYSTVVA